MSHYGFYFFSRILEGELELVPFPITLKVWCQYTFPFQFLYYFSHRFSQFSVHLTIPVQCFILFVSFQYHLFPIIIPVPVYLVCFVVLFISQVFFHFPFIFLLVQYRFHFKSVSGTVSSFLSCYEKLCLVSPLLRQSFFFWLK